MFNLSFSRRLFSSVFQNRAAAFFAARFSPNDSGTVFSRCFQSVLPEFGTFDSEWGNGVRSILVGKRFPFSAVFRKPAPARAGFSSFRRFLISPILCFVPSFPKQKRFFPNREDGAADVKTLRHRIPEIEQKKKERRISKPVLMAFDHRLHSSRPIMVNRKRYGRYPDL